MLRSTSGQIEDFSKSDVWADMQAILRGRLEDYRDDLERNGSIGADRNAGACEGLRYALTIVKVLAALAQQELDRKEKDNV